MNHLLEIDTVNPGSPHYAGTRCLGCGNWVTDHDFDHRCENCTLITCPCGERHPKGDMKFFAGRLLCPGCYEYETT